MNLINLTNEQRLLLANQYLILFLISKNKDEKKYFKKLEGLISGNYNLDLFSNNIDLEDQSLSSKEAENLMCILDLYVCIQRVTKTKFRGFDCNDPLEIKYNYYLEKFHSEGRYKELTAKNSHMRNIELYLAQIDKWKKMKKDTSDETIKSILKK